MQQNASGLRLPFLRDSFVNVLHVPPVNSQTVQVISIPIRPKPEHACRFSYNLTNAHFHSPPPTHLSLSSYSNSSGALPESDKLLTVKPPSKAVKQVTSYFDQGSARTCVCFVFCAVPQENLFHIQPINKRVFFLRNENPSSCQT